MPSVKITLADREFTLLPCPAVGLKTIGRKFEKIGTGSEEGLDALIDGIYFGIKRGIPNDHEFTREFVEWNVDATNLTDLTEAFTTANNAVRKASDTEAAPGEA